MYPSFRSALRASSVWLRFRRNLQCLRPGSGSPPPLRAGSGPPTAGPSPEPLESSATRQTSSPQRAQYLTPRGVPQRTATAKAHRTRPSLRPGIAPVKQRESLTRCRGARQVLPAAGRPHVPITCANGPKTRPLRSSRTPPATYRGPRQVSLFKTAAKRGFSCRVKGSLCFCFYCSVML